MSILNIRNLAYLRNIPVFGARLYEALQDIQQGVGAGFEQGNLNPNGQPEPPPAIQSVTATGQNGVLHVSLDNSSAGLRRGHVNYIEHADNASFNNAQIRNIGDSKSFTEFIGNADRWVRAYTAYPGSAASSHTYHGGAASPQPVNGGGAIGPPAYLPSNGSGTGAAGQCGLGPGPVPVRTDVSGFDWRLQRAQGLSGGFAGSGSPGSQGGIGSGGSGGGGGGGGIVTQPLIVDTHANRLANYPSVRYPVNTEFYESDRTVFYWSQNASGTVTVTTGTTVTWNSGNHFVNTGSGFTAAQWPAGTQIIINGVTCHVASVTNSTTLTLQVATANAGPVSYLVPSGRWVYLSGIYESAYASIPTDLGENDVAFSFYDSTTYIRKWEWYGSGWKYASGELPGGDTSPAVIMLAGTTTPPGYAVCDGTAKTITKADATTVSFTTPLFTTGNFPKGGSYTGATISAVVPTITGHTETGAANIGSDSGGGTNVLAGAVTVASHPHNHTDSGHQHNLSSANAPIVQPSADPVPAVLMMFAVKL